MNTTERGSILEAARAATEGDRNKSYGDPGDQLGLAGVLKEIVRAHMLRDVSPGEMEALDMVLTKLSRAVMGEAPGRDTYVDMAAYAAIAGELAAWEDAEKEAFRATMVGPFHCSEEGRSVSGIMGYDLDRDDLTEPARPHGSFAPFTEPDEASIPRGADPLAQHGFPDTDPLAQSAKLAQSDRDSYCDPFQVNENFRSQPISKAEGNL